MFFFFIIGTRFITWGSEPGGPTMQCARCGTVGAFGVRKGMNFVTLFFVIPVLPISGVKTILQCPTCRARFEAARR
jgi:hypothetical protein